MSLPSRSRVLRSLIALILAPSAIAQEVIDVDRTSPLYKTLDWLNTYSQSSSAPTNIDYLEVGRTLSQLWPGWRSRIPACPCAEPKDAAGWSSSNFFISKFHPGAETCYRSDPVAAEKIYRLQWGSGPKPVLFTLFHDLTHGQQCCYDEAGNLLVNGPGAGTPDFRSPNAVRAVLARVDALRDFHQRLDIWPWENLGWERYGQYWGFDPLPACDVTVPSTLRLTNSGYWVKEGQQVSVRSAGRIRWTAWQGLFMKVEDTMTDPDGTPRNKVFWTSQDPVPDGAVGALVGCIKQDDLCTNAFVIGKARTFRAPATGYLMFTVNDANLGNNEGAFKARVSIPGLRTTSPPPPTAPPAPAAPVRRSAGPPVPAAARNQLLALAKANRWADAYMLAYDLTQEPQFANQAMFASRSGFYGGTAWAANEAVRQKLGAAYPLGSVDAMAKAISAAEFERGFTPNPDGTYSSPTRQDLQEIGSSIWRQAGANAEFPAALFYLQDLFAPATLDVVSGNLQPGRNVKEILAASAGGGVKLTRDGKYLVIANRSGAVQGVLPAQLANPSFQVQYQVRQNRVIETTTFHPGTERQTVQVRQFDFAGQAVP